MGTSRDKFSKDFIEILTIKAKESDRYEIDETKLYVNYSEKEKKLFSSYKDYKSLETNSNETVVFFKDNIGEKYLIVSQRSGLLIDNYDFESIQISFAELSVLNQVNELRIKTDISPDEIIDVIELYDDSAYTGCVFDDISCFIEPYIVFRINSSLDMIEENERIYSYYLLEYYKVNNLKFSSDTIDEFDNIISSGIKIPYNNIISAIDSRQWTHSFLETYRLIEHTFPILYLKNLQDYDVFESPIIVAQILEKVISWHPPEERAIELIISDIINNKDFNIIIFEVSQIINEPQANIAKWYYTKVRNQIVHFRSIHKNVIFSEKEWDTLLRFNLKIIMYMYTRYDSQIDAIKDSLIL